MKTPPFLKNIAILVLLGILFPSSGNAYSVLTHEAIVDACWQKSIVPLLLERFPNTPHDSLKKAHAYAYGGCLIADMGYYPYGSKYFTNLLHYVRSGDFVDALLAEAKTVNEYAFALGALAHYIGDEYGHSMATNLTVPMVYPKIRDKFGSVVTYEDDHISHTRTEFSFDVLQTARGNYESAAYHDFIGFEVDTVVLKKAFLKTYGQDVDSVFKNFTRTVSTFRWAVKSMVPTLTRAAWVLKKHQIKKTNPAITARSFRYNIRNREYNKEFGTDREKPGFKAQVLAFIIRILPKVGALRILKIKDPGPEGEKLFIASFDTTVSRYSDALAKLSNQNISLSNIDFDTGEKTKPGEYGLADETYCELIVNLYNDNFVTLTAPLKQNILSFYSEADTAMFDQRNPQEWQKASIALKQVKITEPVPANTLRVIETPANKPATETNQ